MITLSKSILWAVVATIIAVSSAAAVETAAAPADLAFREEAAFRAAAEKAAPSVVSIETIGGLDTVGEAPVGTGPSSGLIVGSDGYIISSTVNFAHKPASIVVSLGDGRKLPAKLVARDHVRKLVLLKVDGVSGLPVPTAAPQAESVVGVWAIAVGRTYEAARANLSVGIVSAVHRIWGKALQTDAKISPANYGGPLVDIRGRVMGVLVPLSPNENEDISGAEWYDSGIGFAVPLEHIQKVLPRMQSGEDLKAGLLGIRFRGKNVYADPPLLAHVRANSPAYTAGLRNGDLITTVEGRPVELQVQVMEAIQSRYAGDVLRVTIARGGNEKFERELKLVDELDPYRRPFLGVLPERVARSGKEGVGVRYVFENSPARDRRITIGERITAVGETKVTSREQLIGAVADSPPGKPIQLTIQGDAGERRIELQPAAQPETIPARFDTAKPAAGSPLKSEALQIAEYGNACEIYVPDTYSDDIPHGVVMLLHPSGGFEKSRLKTLVAAWAPFCRRDRLILVVPKAADKEGEWAPDDLTFLSKVIDRAAENRNVDPLRIAVIGYEEGGTAAWRTAAGFPERVRLVAVVNGGISGSAPENEPATPLDIYWAFEKGFPNLGRLKAAVERLREAHFPVIVRELPAGGDDLSDDQLDELARRIDMLDRI